MCKLITRAVSYSLSLALHVILGEHELVDYSVPDTSPRTPPPPPLQ